MGITLFRAHFEDSAHQMTCNWCCERSLASTSAKGQICPPFGHLAGGSFTAFERNDSLHCHQVGYGELHTAAAAAHFDQNLGFEQVPEWHACGLPSVEMLSDGYRAALASGFANAVVLRPTRDTVAARATRAGGLTRIEDIVTAINLYGALVAGIPRIDRHPIIRVIDDVPLDTWIGRPTIDSYIRVATSGSRLLVCELRRDLAVRIVSLGGVP